MKSLKLNQRGVVSLMITIIIGLLLITITVSMVILSIGEQRQAQNTDQSTKAFYAAQGGEEFMLYGLVNRIAAKNYSDYNADCSDATLQPAYLDPPGTPPGTGASITCQRILFTDNNVTGSLAKDVSDEVSAGSGAIYDSANVYWGSAADGAIAGACSLSPARTGAAPLEVVIVKYTSASNAPGAVGSRNVVLCPVSGGAAPVIDLGDNTKGQVSVPCTFGPGNAGYACKFSFTHTAADINSYILRMRPRFIGTNYRVDFTKLGAAVNVPSGYATVDVTAKTGDVYRRIAHRIKLQNGLAAGLDYVLYSDDNICKNFSVIGGALLVNSTCQ
jgi:hypothetical protein